MDVSPTHHTGAGYRSLRGLDGVNFFVAAVQTGFGAFVSVYLLQMQWPPQAIGLALTLGTMSNLINQLPAGAFIDSVRDKRSAVFLGIAGVGLAALLLCLTATRSSVYAALVVQGPGEFTDRPRHCGNQPGLVGQAALSERIGRNAQFASIGSGLAAGIMGIVGSYLPAASVFSVAAVLVLPALLSLSLVGRGRNPASPAHGGEEQDQPAITWEGMKTVLLDRRLAIFAACVLLFFAASAAVAPGVAAQVTRRQPDFATLVVAATILLPQATVAAISPWVGRKVERSGRKPLLLVGWGLLPLQGLLYAVLPGLYALVVCNLLNAVSGAIFGVTMTVVAAGLTRRTGCFNLTLGALGVAIAIGASLSTFITGITAAAFGAQAAALGLALLGLAGLVLLWASMPETQEPTAKRSTR